MPFKGLSKPFKDFLKAFQRLSQGLPNVLILTFATLPIIQEPAAPVCPLKGFTKPFKGPLKASERPFKGLYKVF
jgi:hypothetical protein